jgi:hypothetical protein
MVQNPPPEVGKMVEELDLLSSKIKPTQTRQESSVTPKEIAQATSPQPLPEPAHEQAPSPKPVKNRPLPQMEHISFDKAVTRVLEQKMKQIDEEAAAKKREVEDRFYSKLYLFIDSIDVDSPIPTRQPIPPPSSIIYPDPEPIAVAKPKQKGSYVYPKKFKVFLVVAILVASLLIGGILTHAFGTLQTSQQVTNSGVMASPGLGVYTDLAATKNCTNIDWGVTYPGATITRSGYLRNNGNIPMNISLAVGPFVPSEASQYLSVSWDGQYKIIQPGSIVPITVTLATSALTPLSTFSFTIRVDGVQLPQ